MADSFQHTSERFLSWLKNSGTDISPKIQLVDLRDIHAGRGVVATSQIEEDELLFRIPRSSVLSVENSALPKLLPKVFQDLDPWPSLILVMMYEWCQGEKSTWKPYFDVLPSEFNTLMFWSEEELNELQASTVRQKIGKESADTMFREKIYPVIAQHAALLLGEEAAGNVNESDIVGLAHRMGSTIMAYAFDIEPAALNKEADEDGYVSEDEDEALPKGMVPLADMLNADADRNNARLFYEEDYLSMKAIKTITAGEEIFNDYGPLPRSDLLRRYGYITDNYAKYDVVEIPHDRVPEIITRTANIPASVANDRFEYLDEHGVIDTGYDIMASEDFQVLEDISPELIVLTETLLLPQSEFDRLKAKGKLPKPSNISLKGAQLLHLLVRARAGEYDTTLEQDSLQPVSIPTNGSPVSSRRFAMAKSVRMGEKAILQQAKMALANMVKELQPSEADSKRSDMGSDDRSSKRRRMA